MRFLDKARTMNDTQVEYEISQNEIVELLRRGPCSLDDLAAKLVYDRDVILKLMGNLFRSGRVDSEMVGKRKKLFFRAASLNVHE